MPIRTIHVGAWNRARSHLGVMTQSEVFEPVALVDVNEDFMAQGLDLADLGADAAHTSLTEALDKHDCDAVVVVTPVMLHAQFIDEALAAGKHVMVEKPFTVSLEDAERAVASAEAAGLQLLVTQNDRLRPSYPTIRRHLTEETYGPARLRRDDPPQGTFRSVSRLAPHAPLAAGRHQIDSLLSAIPRKPVRARGISVEPAWGTWPTPSLVHSIIEFDDGTSATYVGTSQARHTEFQFTVECSEAALAIIGLHSNDSLLLKRGTEVEAIPTDPPPGGMSQEEQISDMFARQINEGVDTQLSGRNNLTTIRVIDAIARSTASGQAVELP